MAYYLVKAVPKKGVLGELEKCLKNDLFADMKPFGRALTYSLRNARFNKDGSAIWEEEDYCSPPLNEEKRILNLYFSDVKVSPVNEGEGWDEINLLPKIFPELDLVN